MPPAPAAIRRRRPPACARPTRGNPARFGHLRQTQQVHHRDRVARRLGAIVIVLHPQHQAGVVRRRAEESAAVGVFEQLALLFGEPHGQLQVAQVELRLVEIEQRLGEEGVVVQEAGNGRVARRDSGAAGCRSRGSYRLAIRKSGGPPRGLRVARLVEHRAAFGERRDHQPVPGGQNLVVQMRTDAFGARLQQDVCGAVAAPPARRPRGWSKCCAVSSTRVRLEQNVPAGELAVRIVVARCRRRARRSGSRTSRAAGSPSSVVGSRRAPDVERAFALLVGMRGIDHAVGILGRVEAAVRVGHVAQHVIEDARAPCRRTARSPVIWNASR